MDLHTRLLENRSSIRSRWFDSLADTYAPDTAKFLRRQKNAFANPVGSSVREGMEGIIDSVIGSLAGVGPTGVDLDRETILPLLDRIVRIRAVQNFTPTQSVAFVTELGPIFRKVTGDLLGEAELARLEALTRDLLFLAFEIYVTCREKLWEIKIKDDQRAMHLLLRRAKLITEAAPEELNIPDLRRDGPEDNHQ